MWCPLNIAKVDLRASAAVDGVNEQATPSPTTLMQPIESDEMENKPHNQPSTPGAGSDADPATSQNTPGARGEGVGG